MNVTAVKNNIGKVIKSDLEDIRAWRKGLDSRNRSFYKNKKAWKQRQTNANASQIGSYKALQAHCILLGFNGMRYLAEDGTIFWREIDCYWYEQGSLKWHGKFIWSESFNA